jgi:hypothetical protein
VWEDEANNKGSKCARLQVLVKAMEAARRSPLPLASSHASRHSQPPFDASDQAHGSAAFNSSNPSLVRESSKQALEGCEGERPSNLLAKEVAEAGMLPPSPSRPGSLVCTSMNNVPSFPDPWLAP